MIISRTPFRISFFGGGTDYPDWYLQHGGAVVSTSFDKYSYLTCRELPPFFDYNYRITYSQVENVKAIVDIQHPAVRACLQEEALSYGVEIHHSSDLPARSGLGSSSSFVVGLINILRHLQGQTLSAIELAEQAIYIEREVLQEAVGAQDQIAVACGGFNRIDFGAGDGDINVTPVNISDARKADLNDHLMLFFTGITRFASQLAQAQIQNFGAKEKELKTMQAMVDDAVKMLETESDLYDFGKMLHENWLYKKSLTDGISSTVIDDIYKRAQEAGAIGGKLLGAGGGGFILFFVAPEQQDKVKKALAPLVHVPFRFESEGTKIIYK